MTLRFAIVGAGWYGCHIGTSLAALGFEIDVFEKSNRILGCASGNNQSRLHLGFHYARHIGTRIQSRDGFSRFLERYPTLSAPIAENWYAVPSYDSLIDFATYRVIMTSTGIHFTEIPLASTGFRDVDGVINTGERVLLTTAARHYFLKALGPALHLETEVTSIVSGPNGAQVNGKSYDYVIDATWGHFKPPMPDVFYEPTLLLYYETKQPVPAITFVDGPLCSLYPTEDQTIYTLSSVPHTPLGQFKTAAAAVDALARIDGATIAAKRRLMEDHFSKYCPGMINELTYMAPQFAIKTKPFGAYDNRSCYVTRQDRVFSIMSGKIDTIFFATERILSMIESEGYQQAEVIEPSLRREISG